MLTQRLRFEHPRTIVDALNLAGVFDQSQSAHRYFCRIDGMVPVRKRFYVTLQK